jgi:hypothetical protein
MSYFPHAFQKMLAATHPAGGVTPIPFPNGGSTPATTSAISAGQVAIVNALTNLPIDPAIAPTYGPSTVANAYSQVYLAQGSFHLNDKIGPFHGGYKESVKSKGINAKFVSSFYRTDPSNPVNDVIEICQTNCGLTCDTMYDLRLDIKGSPALRFLNHNLYQTLSAYSGCCTNLVSPTTPDLVDPTVVLLQWADQINSVSSGNNSTPFLSQFVQAFVWVKTALSTTCSGTIGTSQITVVSAGAGATAIQAGNKVKFNGYSAYVGSTYVAGSTTVPLVNQSQTPFVLPATVAAGTAISVYRTTTTATYTPATGASANTVSSCIDIIGAYVDTVFGDCSFDPKDYFEVEPIQLYASLAAYANNANDLGGDTCAVSCFTITEIQNAVQGKGFGETLVRELILAKRYQQEPWYGDPRLREVLNDTVLGTSNAGGPEITRGTKYSVYYLLHSIPRKNNPTGVFDNDQYLVKIVVPSYTGSPAASITNMTTFQTWWNTWLTSAGTGVVLQVVA